MLEEPRKIFTGKPVRNKNTRIIQTSQMPKDFFSNKDSLKRLPKSGS